MLALDWRTKPIPILISTALWGGGAVFAIMYVAVWSSNEKAPSITAFLSLFTITLCVSFAILGFLHAYWLGHQWTRYVAVFFAVMGLWRDVQAALWLYVNFPHYWLILPLSLAEFTFNIYLLRWLLSKESRNFFLTEHKVA